MKNFGSLILGIFLGALCMYFYLNNNKEKGLNPIIKPRGVISSEAAMVLDSTYNSRYNLISDSIVKRPDNRSTWWSIEDISNYIVYAKSEANSLGYSLDGLRVYLGAYPTVKDTVGYTTMFIVPTGSLSKDNDSIGFRTDLKHDIKDIDPLNMGSGGNPPNSNYPQ